MTENKSSGRHFHSDLICLLILTATIVVVFSSTIFQGKDISRAGTVAHNDTLFGRFAKGKFDPMDTSIYQEHIPDYFLAEHVIAGGNLPLWNPYLGFGCPLWSDPQVLAFSPLTWLQAPFASMRVYNLLTVFQIWLGGVIVYIMARLLRISPAGATLAAATSVFCPYSLYMMEWNRCESVFFALPFLGFVYLWRRGNTFSIIICAILCMLAVVSGHASPTFFSIAFASFMYFVLSYIFPQNEAGEKGRPSWLLPVKNFLLTGILTFLLSAPIVVPFVATMAVSDCFKATQVALTYIVRPTALIPSLFFPFHGAASPYPGVVSVILCLGAIFISRKNRRLIAIFSGLMLITLGVMTRFGPFHLIFQLPFLSWLMLVYAMPAFALFMCILSGLGYDALLEEKARMRSAIVIASAAVIPLSVPFVFKMMHLSPREMILNDWVKTMMASSSVQVRELVCILIAVLVVFVMVKLPAKIRFYAALSLILLNTLDLSFSFRKSMPAQSAFTHEEVEPIGFLKDQRRRVISMGRHVFVPNTAQIFSVSELLSFLPVQPRGVISYLKALGITIEGVSQFAESPLTKLIDVASVKYAIASEPVLSSEDTLPEPIDIAANGIVKFGPQLGLKGYSVAIDAENLDVVGKLKWQRKHSQRAQKDPKDPENPKNPSSLLYVPLIIREEGGVVWIGDRHPVSGKNIASPDLESIVSAVIPKSLKAGETVCLILQVIDSSTGKLVEPMDVPLEMQMRSVPKSILLKRFTVPSISDGQSKSPARHFRLIKETAPEMVRVYENTGCLPEAYLVYKSRQVKGIDNAIAQMLQADFDPSKVALTEKPTVLGNSQIAPDDELVEARVSRPNVNEVIAACQTSKPALLVLSDVYFPGWKATIDGQETEIYRANALFRAVKVGPGQHIVRFFYDPLEVKLGFFLFAAGLAVIVFLFRSGQRAQLVKNEDPSD